MSSFSLSGISSALSKRANDLAKEGQQPYVKKPIFTLPNKVEHLADNTKTDTRLQKVLHQVVIVAIIILKGLSYIPEAITFPLNASFGNALRFVHNRNAEKAALTGLFSKAHKFVKAFDKNKELSSAISNWFTNLQTTTAFVAASGALLQHEQNHPSIPQKMRTGITGAVRRLSNPSNISPTPLRT